jgi:hypothetical protein
MAHFGCIHERFRTKFTRLLHIKKKLRKVPVWGVVRHSFRGPLLLWSQTRVYLAVRTWHVREEIVYFSLSLQTKYISGSNKFGERWFKTSESPSEGAAASNCRGNGTIPVRGPIRKCSLGEKPICRIVFSQFRCPLCFVIPFDPISNISFIPRDADRIVCFVFLSVRRDCSLFIFSKWKCHDRCRLAKIGHGKNCFYIISRGSVEGYSFRLRMLWFCWVTLLVRSFEIKRLFGKSSYQSHIGIRIKASVRGHLRNNVAIYLKIKLNNNVYFVFNYVFERYV